MNKRKIISILMIGIGTFPFLYILYRCVDAAINGFTFGWGAPAEHGAQAFLSVLVLGSYVLWPAYIIGIVLIIIGILLLRKNKK